MYHVSAQGVDERMMNVHYYYAGHVLTRCFSFLHCGLKGEVQEDGVQVSCILLLPSPSSDGTHEHTHAMLKPLCVRMSVGLTSRSYRPKTA